MRFRLFNLTVSIEKQETRKPQIKKGAFSPIHRKHVSGNYRVSSRYASSSTFVPGTTTVKSLYELGLTKDEILALYPYCKDKLLPLLK